MAKMDILMRAERVRKDTVTSISSLTQTVEQFKDNRVYCLPVRSVYLLERRFKEHSLPIVCCIWSKKLSPSQIPCLSGVLLKHQSHPCGGLLENVGFSPTLSKSFWAPIWVSLACVFATSNAWSVFSYWRAFQRIFNYSKRLRDGWVVMIQRCPLEVEKEKIISFANFISTGLGLKLIGLKLIRILFWINCELPLGLGSDLIN